MHFQAHFTLAALAPLLGLISATVLPKDFYDSKIEVRDTCTTTLHQLPHITAGPTKTVWTLTSTQTVTIDCGGCDAVSVSTVGLGPGPVVIYTTTVTAATPSVTTALACSAT